MLVDDCSRIKGFEVIDCMFNVYCGRKHWRIEVSLDIAVVLLYAFLKGLTSV